MICDHQQQDGCKLGLFGGKPLPGNCRECIRAGENNPEYAARLFASREKTHPSGVRKVSGCCDSALNPPDPGLSPL